MSSLPPAHEQPDQKGLPKLGSILYQAAVEFPKSAYTIQRVPDQHASAVTDTSKETDKLVEDSTSGTLSTAPTEVIRDGGDTDAAMPHLRKDSGYAGHEHVLKEETISPALAELCQSPDSVSGMMAKDPSLSPGQAWKKLLEHSGVGHHSTKHHHEDSESEKTVQSELDVALKCGSWGDNRPSDLFLQMYHDALCTLNRDPSLGVASPSLLGSTGTVPLTVLSVIPDIMRHMSNLIVRAEKEVILATNFWQASTASSFIVDAIREASRRAGERGQRLTMKIIYDRGSPKQLFDSHYMVSEKEWTGKAVGLPAAHEIPNIDLEVANIHIVALGTFHSKFMIVDRKIGIVQSNNIQDNDNLEMMVHVEGAIVDGLYDMFLLSWHKKFRHDLPLLSAGSCHAASTTPAGLAADPANIGTKDGSGTSRFAKRAAPYGIDADTILEPAQTIDEHMSKTPVVGAQRNVPQHQSEEDNLAVEQLHITESDTQTVPALAEHTHDDPHYDDDIAGEVARVQAAVSAKPSETQMEAVTRHLNHTVNKGFKGVPPPAPAHSADDDAMTPYILHPPCAKPFPVALVNRAPYGPPNHESVSNPQNAAWLSALRNARKNVFIQSPTLNAEPLVPAIVEACERGVDVYAYICLGYNDAGELLPMQGGHNEMVAAHLYSRLASSTNPEARNRLHYYWYTAKDQVAPIPALQKRRSCHVKLMIVDETIGIVGSGNQDTQSWYHSQEVNIMLESREVCAAWIDALRRNQNTHRFGALGKEDGVWRDKDGKEAEGAMGVDPGRFSWLKGFTGAIKRVQGTGGF